MPFGPPGDNSFKYIGQPGQRFNTIQFRRLHQRCNDCPVASAVVVSGEQRILPCYRYGSDGTLNSVRVQLQAAIFEKDDQSVPVVQRVTDCLGQGGSTWDTAELFVEPDMHGLDERPALLMAHALTFLSGLTANAGLDRVQFGDPLHGFFRDRRFGRDKHLVELPSRVGPTESELWSIAGRIGDQASEPGIAVDLDQAAITLQMIR